MDWINFNKLKNITYRGWLSLHRVFKKVFNGLLFFISALGKLIAARTKTRGDFTSKPICGSFLNSPVKPVTAWLIRIALVSFLAALFLSAVFTTILSFFSSSIFSFFSTFVTLLARLHDKPTTLGIFAFVFMLTNIEVFVSLFILLIKALFIVVFGFMFILIFTHASDFAYKDFLEGIDRDSLAVLKKYKLFIFWRSLSLCGERIIFMCWIILLIIFLLIFSTAVSSCVSFFPALVVSLYLTCVVACIKSFDEWIFFFEFVQIYIDAFVHFYLFLVLIVSIIIFVSLFFHALKYLLKFLTFGPAPVI